LLLLWSGPALADPDACPEAGRIVSTGGVESAGVGGTMVCRGGTWDPIIRSDGTGQITELSNQTCGAGQVIGFDGATWACRCRCGAGRQGRGQVEVMTRKSAFTAAAPCSNAL
jgi:hypothetical protein